MKKNSKVLFSFFMILFSLSFIGIKILANNRETIKVIDVKEPLGDIKNYRVISALDVSGSSQFSPKQLNNLITLINKESILIIDLRQESHGFINEDIAFSYYGNAEVLNSGLSPNAVIMKEIKDLEEINLNREIELFRKVGEKGFKKLVKKVSTEGELVRANNIQYIRLSVKENELPTSEVVDNFINIVKNKPTKIHTHFHCKDGGYRTTLFLTMYQIMKDKDIKSLDEIIKYQQRNNGSNLENNERVMTFLNNFYQYVKENVKDNYETAYSIWNSTK